MRMDVRAIQFDANIDIAFGAAGAKRRNDFSASRPVARRNRNESFPDVRCLDSACGNGPHLSFRAFVA
jgi:hypothetical protein